MKKQDLGGQRHCENKVCNPRMYHNNSGHARVESGHLSLPSLARVLPPWVETGAWREVLESTVYVFWNHNTASLAVNVQFQKIMIPTHGKSLEILRRWEDSNMKIFKGKYEAEQEFPDGWVGGWRSSRTKILPWGVWIFSGITLLIVTYKYSCRLIPSKSFGVRLSSGRLILKSQWRTRTVKKSRTCWRWPTYESTSPNYTPWEIWCWIPPNQKLDWSITMLCMTWWSEEAVHVMGMPSSVFHCQENLIFLEWWDIYVVIQGPGF